MDAARAQRAERFQRGARLPRFVLRTIAEERRREAAASRDALAASRERIRREVAEITRKRRERRERQIIRERARETRLREGPLNRAPWRNRKVLHQQVRAPDGALGARKPYLYQATMPVDSLQDALQIVEEEAKFHGMEAQVGAFIRDDAGNVITTRPTAWATEFRGALRLTYDEEEALGEDENPHAIYVNMRPRVGPGAAGGAGKGSNCLAVALESFAGLYGLETPFPGGKYRYHRLKKQLGLLDNEPVPLRCMDKVSELCGWEISVYGPDGAMLSAERVGTTLAAPHATLVLEAGHFTCAERPNPTVPKRLVLYKTLPDGTKQTYTGGSTADGAGIYEIKRKLFANHAGANGKAVLRHMKPDEDLEQAYKEISEAREFILEACNTLQVGRVDLFSFGKISEIAEADWLRTMPYRIEDLGVEPQKVVRDAFKGGLIWADREQLNVPHDVVQLDVNGYYMYLLSSLQQKVPLRGGKFEELKLNSEALKNLSSCTFWEVQKIEGVPDYLRLNRRWYTGHELEIFLKRGARIEQSDTRRVLTFAPSDCVEVRQLFKSFTTKWRAIEQRAKDLKAPAHVVGIIKRLSRSLWGKLCQGREVARLYNPDREAVPEELSVVEAGAHDGFAMRCLVRNRNDVASFRGRLPAIGAILCAEGRLRMWNKIDFLQKRNCRVFRLHTDGFVAEARAEKLLASDIHPKKPGALKVERRGVAKVVASNRKPVWMS